ncbi:MAG: DMT family transporter [Bacteroidetes bacterium]|nr:DMT family transporter [Bacteroidota bacterium]
MPKFAPVFIILAAALWGVDGVLLRPYLYNLPVSLVVFIESGIVILILSPLFIRRFDELKSLTKSDWISFFFVALLGGAIGTMSITKALFYVNYVNLSIVVLMQKLQPVFAILLASVILKEKLKKNFLGWASLAMIGAYLMTFGLSIPNLGTGNKTAIAGMYALIAAISFGASTVISKRALRNVGFGAATYLRFLFATIILSVVAVVSGNISAITSVSFDQLLIFLLIAFSTGGAAIFLYYYGLKNVTASVATICELAFPLTAVLLEYFLRDNILSFVQWGGVFFLFIAIIQITRLRKS